MLEVKARTAEKAAAITPHVHYVGAIRRALPRDGIFVEEICQAGFASYFALPVYGPRTFVTCGYQGTLGFGYATALGAKVARPDLPVVAVTGDGGFGFALQELVTAAQYGIGVVCVLFDNSAYGNVWRDQGRLYAAAWWPPSCATPTGPRWPPPATWPASRRGLQTSSSVPSRRRSTGATPP